LDILGPCSTEHKGLTIRPDLGNDLSDLRLETHVQHTVSLIHDKVRDAAEISLLGFQHVDETAGGGNDNFDAPGEVTNLRTLGSAAINRGIANPRVRTSKYSELEPHLVKGSLPKLCALLLDLNSKLTSGRKDQRYWAVSGIEQWLAELVLEPRM